MKVLTTTTTKIFMPEPDQTSAVILSDRAEDVLVKAEKLLKRYGCITAGADYPAGKNKIKGVFARIDRRFTAIGEI